MGNMIITYRVTGRYMTGSTVSAYHLVGCDGSQIIANKDRIIYMIGKGLIENMRLQVSGDEMIIRGKGINLNNLPVFDTNKGDFRSNQGIKNPNTLGGNNRRNNGVNPMGQLTLIKRIMYKQSCLGYIVVDHLGVERKLSRDRVVELAAQHLLSNAVVQKYSQRESNGNTQLILRGMGCDIRNLPIVTVDENGNIVDTENSNDKSISVRAVKMKYGGILYNRENNTKLVFEPTDYMICTLDGRLKILKNSESKRIESLNKPLKSRAESLEKLSMYPVEIFGRPIQTLSADTIRKWPMVKII